MDRMVTAAKKTANQLLGGFVFRWSILATLVVCGFTSCLFS
jgi:hypothetical protein